MTCFSYLIKSADKPGLQSNYCTTAVFIITVRGVNRLKKQHYKQKNYIYNDSMQLGEGGEGRFITVLYCQHLSHHIEPAGES